MVRTVKTTRKAQPASGTGKTLKYSATQEDLALAKSGARPSPRMWGGIRLVDVWEWETVRLGS